MTDKELYISWKNGSLTSSQAWLRLTGNNASEETARKYMNGLKHYLHKNDENYAHRKVVGVFGDTHIPFHHPNYLQFVKDTFEKYQVTDIVCTGDIFDFHAISRFQSEASAKSSYDELDMAIESGKEYTDTFPNVIVTKSNHDSIPYRQAATLGLGERFLKKFNELMELPPTWVLKTAHIMDDVLYKHGENCGGKDGAINAAINERMSTVIGHQHSFAGCKYVANHRDIIFGMNVGCGIDVDAYAFAYGKHAKYRPILGCGIVYSSDYAQFVPMGLEYFRGD